MKYVLTGNLSGFHCQNCSDPLSRVGIKLYQADATPNVTALAVASEKVTFHQRSDEELRSLPKLLLAEAETDDLGNFSVELPEQRYNGGAFDLDFECGTVPIRIPIPPKPKGPFQFNITTLQPNWRATESEQKKERGTATAFYQYSVPAKWLCRIYALFDVWVICGKVTDCRTKKPRAGLKVTAFDVDWLQDDELGSDITDSNGKFRIVYDGDQFRKTLLSPWLNIEWPAGPDYFFRIESGSGEIYLNEDRSVGHQRGRENAGNCFCIDFCVDGAPDITDKSWFTHVGDFNITSAISPAGTALVTQPGPITEHYGFFGNIKLKGYVSKKFPPALTNPLYYRFLYSLDGSSWNNITETHLAGPLIVGVREIDWNGVSKLQNIVIDHSQAASVPDSFPIYPSGTVNAPVPNHVLHLDTNGWVRVDQQGINHGFHGPLLYLKTTTIVPGGNTSAVETVGEAVASPQNGTLVHILFQTTDNPADPTRFVTQSEKATLLINNWSVVNLLNLVEFKSSVEGCTPIKEQAHVKYTTDHEFSSGWSITLQSTASGLVGGLPSGPGRSANSPLPDGLDLTTITPFSAANDPTVTSFAELPSCAYRLRLTTSVKLTDGERYADPVTEEILFCR